MSNRFFTKLQKQLNGRRVFLTNGGTTGYPSTAKNNNNNFNLNLTSSTKTKLKWILDLNVKCENINLLGKSIGENLCDLSKEILNTTPKAWSIRENNKLKTFSAKDHTKKMKSQATRREKIPANYISDRGRVFWIYKEFFKLNSKKTKNPVFKMGKKTQTDLYQRTRDNIWMANKYIKICSTSWAIGEIHIKATMRCHFTSIRKAKIKNSDYTNFWQGCRETGSLIHSCWKCKVVQPLEKIVWLCFFKLKHTLNMWLRNHTFRYLFLRNENMLTQKAHEFS